jgi:hypothetical protein
MMRRLSFWIALAAWATCASAWPTDLAEMQKSLAEQGGKATLQTYFNCENGQGYAAVETGAPDAVAFGVEMLKYSDACVTESLLSSLGAAMQANPAAVLPYVGRTPLLAAERICLPFLSAEEPDDKLKPIVARSRRAIESVRDPALRSQQAACRREIDQAEQMLDH